MTMSEEQEKRFWQRYQRKEKEREFLTGYYSQLVGGSIKEFILKQDEDGSQWPTFIIEVQDKTYTVEVSQDPEGNGPGFLTLDDGEDEGEDEGL